MSRWSWIIESQVSDHDCAEAEEHLLDGKTSHLSLQMRYFVLEKSYKRLRALTYVAGATLVLSCIVLLVLGLKVNRKASVRSRTPSPMPTFSTTSVTFELDDRFAGPSSVENDQAWNALMPVGDGFIHLKDPSRFGLPPGKAAFGGGFVYDVSVFHALHCLSSIRSHLYLLQASIGRNNSEEIQQYLLDPQIGHVYHCFDYIRQMTMCGGDMTMEWPREEADGSRFAFDGWGITHQCKDWDAIVKFMTKNDAAHAEEA